MTGILTVFFMCLFLQRMGYNYNNNGAYLSNDGIIFYKQTLEVYGVFTIICLFFTIVFILLLKKMKAK